MNKLNSGKTNYWIKGTEIWTKNKRKKHHRKWRKSEWSRNRTDILAKSSNRPFYFYWFSPKPKTILQFCLNPQIGRCVSQLRRFDKTLNITPRMRRWTQATPFWKFTKFSILSQIVKNHFLKYQIFMSKTTLLLKPKTKINRLMQKWTLFLHESGRFGSKC